MTQEYSLFEEDNHYKIACLAEAPGGFIQSILCLLTWVGSILITIYAYNSIAGYLTSKILQINFF